MPWGGGPTATTMNGIGGHTQVDIDGSPDDPQERSGTTGSGTYTGFTPSPESVQEVKSETAPYDAEVRRWRRNTDLILRSGTNAYSRRRVLCLPKHLSQRQLLSAGSHPGYNWSVRNTPYERNMEPTRRRSRRARSVSSRVQRTRQDLLYGRLRASRISMDIPRME